MNACLFYLTASLGLGAVGGPADIPALHWTVRGDWIVLTRDVRPRAAGNGTSDDTAALQAGLNRLKDGDSLYLPPGVYRITGTLVLEGPRVGLRIVGAGRDTRIVWDGPAGGVMFRSNGAAYTRFVGIVWDGRNRAAVAVDHASRKRFETEVTHRNEAFLHCTHFGIRIGWKQKVASAEFYREPAEMMFEGKAGPGAALVIAGSYFYRSKPVFRFGNKSPLILLVGDHGVRDRQAPRALDRLGLVFDALRRLGRLDAAMPAPVLP